MNENAWAPTINLRLGERPAIYINGHQVPAVLEIKLSQGMDHTGSNGIAHVTVTFLASEVIGLTAAQLIETGGGEV